MCKARDISCPSQYKNSSCTNYCSSSQCNPIPGPNCLLYTQTCASDTNIGCQTNNKYIKCLTAMNPTCYTNVLKSKCLSECSYNECNLNSSASRITIASSMLLVIIFLTN